MVSGIFLDSIPCLGSSAFPSGNQTWQFLQSQIKTEVGRAFRFLGKIKQIDKKRHFSEGS
jgi:hypothetical protein